MSPSNPKYQCWGDDHEDLTALVVAAAGDDDDGGVVFGADRVAVKADTPSEGTKTVIVRCSKGHENVFEVGG